MTCRGMAVYADRRTLDFRSSIVTPAKPEEHRGHKTMLARTSYKQNILLYTVKPGKGKEAKAQRELICHAEEAFIRSLGTMVRSLFGMHSRTQTVTL